MFVNHPNLCSSHKLQLLMLEDEGARWEMFEMTSVMT